MAGTTNPNTPIDALLTTTSNLYYEKGKVFDNVFESSDTLKALKAHAKREEIGGAKIQVNVMYGHNEAVDSYSRYEQVNIAPQDGMTSAFYDWAQYSAPVSIDGLSEFQNSSASKIQSLLGEKIEQASMSFAERINKDLMDVADSVATGITGNGGKNIISLPLLMQKDPTTGADVGGIDQSAETWWANQTKDSDAAGTTGVIFKNTMRNIYNSCTRGAGGQPDLIITDQVSHERYESSLDELTRYTSTNKGDVGFEHLVFKNARMVWDPYCPDMGAGTDGVPGTPLTHGSMFFINTKFLKLICGKGKDFAPTAFRTPVDQDARTQLWLFYGQLVTSNRRKNGVLYDIDPANA